MSDSYIPVGGAVLMEGTDPVRMRLALPGGRVVEIPGDAWHALKAHVRDTDPRLTETKRSLDEAEREVRRLSDDRDHWQQEAENRQRDADLWKALAERQDNTAPIRRELSGVERERDEWKRRYEIAQANAEYVRGQYTAPDEAAQMRAAIVRQAREISLLSGESE
ncbi:hypothetical protein [Streptomyces sp. NPDC002952]|uniref:hypothetical protein n=1 Tax=Streptomyces sp. NPDC002952 TaxID=3364673 RepID=UPI00368EC0B2